MSFILDALKKSEQQRPKAVVPDLYTEHAPLPPKGKPRRFWFVLLTLILLVNAGCILWWLRPWDRSQPMHVTAPPPASSVSNLPSSPVAPPVRATAATVSRPEPRHAPPAVSAIPDRKAPAVPERQLSLGAEPARKEPVEEGADRTRREDREAPRSRPAAKSLAYGDLPPELRREIPPFDISLHFYTAAPSARMVRINGRNLREGEAVVDGLTLERITASGVVLNWRGSSFRAGDY